jgi:hypothetical protein
VAPWQYNVEATEKGQETIGAWPACIRPCTVNWTPKKIHTKKFVAACFMYRNMKDQKDEEERGKWFGDDINSTQEFGLWTQDHLETSYASLAKSTQQLKFYWSKTSENHIKKNAAETNSSTVGYFSDTRNKSAITRVFQGYRIQGNVCVLTSYNRSKDTPIQVVRIERIPKDSTIYEIKGRSLDRPWLMVPIALI